MRKEEERGKKKKGGGGGGRGIGKEKKREMKKENDLIFQSRNFVAWLTVQESSALESLGPNVHRLSREGERGEEEG